MDKEERDNKFIIKLVAVSLVAAILVIMSLVHFHNASSQVAQDKAAIPTLQQAIKAAKKQNTTKNTSSKTSKATSEQDIQNEMNQANTFVLNYLKAIQTAQSSDVQKINNTYLNKDAALDRQESAGDDDKTGYNIFAGDANQIQTTPSLPQGGQITVYATSPASSQTSFTAVYDLATKKIMSTQTYRLTK